MDQHGPSSRSVRLHEQDTLPRSQPQSSLGRRQHDGRRADQPARIRPWSVREPIQRLLDVDEEPGLSFLDEQSAALITGEDRYLSVGDARELELPLDVTREVDEAGSRRGERDTPGTMTSQSV